nr:hypothetical protein [Tanacetum cinerariifolium]
FKKPASPQLTTILVSLEEPTKKSKRVKRFAKKSSKASAGGVVIRETSEMPLSKKKKKMDVARGKGIELLSEVALTEEARYKEFRRKSLGDFHKTHPSGSEESSENEAESWGNDKDDINNEQDFRNSEHETDENKSDSESNQDENEEDIGDDEEEEDEFVRTPSNDSDDETKISDKAKGDED